MVEPTEPTVRELMADALDAAMRERGVTNAELGLQIGVSERMIRRWRKRTGPMPRLWRYIAAAVYLDSPEMAAVLFREKGWSICPPESELARHHELLRQHETARAIVSQAVTLLMSVVGTVTPTG